MADLEKQIEEVANLTSSPSAFMLGFDYGKQKMYSEEDLYEILNKFRKEFSLHRGIQIMDFDIKKFIEQNKKK